MCVVSTAPPFPLGRIPTFERARMLQYSLHWMPIGLQFSIVSPNEGLFFVKKTFSQSPKAKEHARVFGEIDSKRSNTFQSLLGLQAAKSQEIRWRMEEWPATWQGQACGLEEEICGRPELRLVLRNVQVHICQPSNQKCLLRGALWQAEATEVSIPALAWPFSLCLDMQGHVCWTSLPGYI